MKIDFTQDEIDILAACVSSERARLNLKRSTYTYQVYNEMYAKLSKMAR